MGTAFLASRDCLSGRFRCHQTLTLTKPRLWNPNSTAAPNLSHHSRRRKRSPAGFQPEKSNQRNGSSQSPSVNLVMGQVRILKRGESLASIAERTENPVVLAENRKPRAKKVEDDVDLALGSTDRLGPDPETVQKQIGMKDINKFVDAMYAGSAFLASPPPSSLPVPCFLGKGNNGAATNDLRRLLRLD